MWSSYPSRLQGSVASRAEVNNDAGTSAAASNKEKESHTSYARATSVSKKIIQNIF